MSVSRRGADVFNPAEIIVASGVKPGAKPSDAYEVCSDAVKHGIRSVCIPTAYLGEVAVFVRNTGLKTSIMVSFPTGLMPVELKTMEMRLAAEQRVEEVFFYPNVGNYLDSRIVEFEWELSRIAEESSLIGLKNVKPVLETDLVSEKQLKEIISIFKTSGFDTVIISSGFGLKNMSLDELRILNTIDEPIMVEAHCRVRSLQDVRNLVENRVCRVCTIDYKVVSEEASDRLFKE